MEPERLLFSLDQAAEALGGISIHAVRHLVATGRLERRKIGRRIFIPAASLRKFASTDQPVLGIPFGGHREALSA